jgi:hypothetical protein
VIVGKTGIIALLGSGETSSTGGQIFETVASKLENPVNIRILETPAGFELNASRVAGRVGEFLSTRLQNYHPDIKLIPARRRGIPESPDSPKVLQEMLDAHLLFMGPGSPTYAVRQLKGSLAWDYFQTLHRLGCAVVLASAATISFGEVALPVYEIYKVGEDPFWKPGLDFFKPYGLSLAFIPHWNNTEGGNELDTSHCFIGLARYDPLYHQLPPDFTVVGLDEHTGVVIDLNRETCQVIGRSLVHIISGGKETVFQNGDRFDIHQLGDFHPLQDVQSGIDPIVWRKVSEQRQAMQSAQSEPESAPAGVIKLVEERQTARENKRWAESDRLRDRIAALGWNVKDTPQGPQLERS